MEVLKLLIGKRQYTLPSLIVSFAEKFATDRSEFENQIRALGELKERLTKQLGPNGVLLMPVNPRKAPKLGATYTRPFDFAYTGIINALGFPSTAVPMGLSKEGLPLSLQVVAAENQDHLCLSMARLLETGFGGWKPSKLLS
jgi:fatty acid amide hydrolase 2